MKIALHSKIFTAEKYPYIRQVFEELKKRRARIYISEDFETYLSGGPELPAFEGTFSGYSDLSDFDIMISIGGDGTLLEAVTLVRDSGVPILGINTGRLGFLATLPSDEIRAGIEALFAGDYSLDRRSLISLDSNRNVFGDMNFALNDFTVTKRDSASMIVVHTYMDGDYLNSYWADGLIVSTPTGSTGYSLSVGGPVVVPQSQSFIVAPISPHNLNVRPLIVSDSCSISMEVEGRSNNFLISLDSRSRIVDSGIRMTVRKCDFQAKLIRLKGESFLKTLRQKVNWGLDNRN